MLQLVLQEDVDITRVSLASVCEQYLSFLSWMEALDIAIASEYLVIAATLIFIKSKRLLPAPPFAEEPAEDAALAEDTLRRRLIAYQHFKHAAAGMRERLEQSQGYYSRPPAPTDGFVQRFVLEPGRLSCAFARVLETAQARPALIKRDRCSVIGRMNWALRFIRERGAARLSELVAGCDLLETVATFLALLELIRARKLAFEQRYVFGDVVLRPARRPAQHELAQSA